MLVTRLNSQNMTDPTLPPNPRKADLYRPSSNTFLGCKLTLLTFDLDSTKLR
ncbi:hypothetical protein AALP_AA3G029200 [Arabis alpina]|uniref:Uncharacterized protein n=1 Tax=Arabis alpina TaxID=50452 RepID=A0A087H6N6_ARAAL|nr:hypothetical protein AALP_AA3G029200 [Arabis alpina]